MGRNDKKYSKTLHQQAYDTLTSMIAFGESKRKAKLDGIEKERIFSFDTYKTYWKHTKLYLSWLKETHPNCSTLKTAKKYVNEWLQTRVEKGLSAWTVQTEAAALNKLFRIDKTDQNRFQPPPRLREHIKRSRISVSSDKHFSKTNNQELIEFCRGTGCRRNVLERLEGRDLWSRAQMERRVVELRQQDALSTKQAKHLQALEEGLTVFPDQKDFLHHRKDKGGRYRFAPIIGPNRDAIISRIQNTGSGEKVWGHVNKRADIHAYRSDYATNLYKQLARPIKDIPFDRINHGSGHRYQSEVYACRKDEAGKKLDKRAMQLTSIALGHNRISVIASNYLRGL